MVNSVKVKNSGSVTASFQDSSGKELLNGRIILPYAKTGNYRITFTKPGSTGEKTDSVACEILRNPSSLGVLEKLYYYLFFKELTVIIGGKETQLFVNKSSLKKRLKNQDTLKVVSSLSQHKRTLSKLTDWKNADESIELVTRSIEIGKTGQTKKPILPDLTVTAQAERVYSLFFNEKAYVFKNKDKTQILLANRERLGSGGENVVYKDLLYTQGDAQAAIRRKPHTQKDEEKVFNFAELNKDTRKILNKLKGVGGIVQPSHVLTYSTRRKGIRTVEIYPNYNHGDLFSLKARSLISSRKMNAMSQALQALANLHTSKIVHGDIKPENILINKNADNTFTLGLHDFGFARDISSGLQKMTACTRGTPLYLPLEHFTNEGKPIAVSTSQDLWAMGLTLYNVMHDNLFPGYVFSKSTLETLNDPELDQIDVLKTALKNYNESWESEKNRLDTIIKNTATTEGDRLNAQIDRLILNLLAPLPLQRPSAEETLKQLQVLS